MADFKQKDITEVLDLFEKVAVKAIKAALIEAGQNATDQQAINVLTKLGLRHAFKKEMTDEFLFNKATKEPTKEKVI